MTYPEYFLPNAHSTSFYQYDRHNRPEIYYQSNKVTKLGNPCRRYFEVYFGRLDIDTYELEPLTQWRWDYEAIADKDAQIQRTYQAFLKILEHNPTQKPIHPYRKDPDPFLDELEHLTWLADHGLER